MAAAAAAAARRRRGCLPCTLALLLLLLLLVVQLQPAAGLFGFGKKKQPDEAAAKAVLEESMADAAAKRKEKKEAAAPKKRKPVAGVTARKIVLTKEVVVGQNLTIKYDVHNAGPLTAHGVVIDDSAGLAGLTVLEGEAVITFGELQPHTRAQQRVVVTADSERVIPAYKAMVGWTVIDPETEEEVADEALSTPSPVIEVLTWTNYRKAKKMYGKEYGLFLLGVLPPVLLPLIVWLALAATNERRYGKKKRR